MDQAGQRTGPDPGTQTVVASEIRRFWNDDAVVYDASPSHYPQRPQERAAWAAVLRGLLPGPPARVLDAGAGTGFLSLLLAGQGYEVTALDLSPGMLARLGEKAAERGLLVEIVEGDAANPPAGEYDAVVERHLLWTLPDPARALAAWRAVTPGGRLVAIEGTWGGEDRPQLDKLRSHARALVDKLRGTEPGHHDHYNPELRAALPYSGGLTPADAVRLVQDSPWGAPRIVRLRDVEWSITEGKGFLDKLLGTHARWAVVADS